MATKKKEATVQVKKAVEPTYTVAEFAQAPESLGVTSPDIIRAAFTSAGKTEATVEDAKELVKKFKNKEVK